MSSARIGTGGTTLAHCEHINFALSRPGILEMPNREKTMLKLILALIYGTDIRPW